MRTVNQRRLVILIVSGGLALIVLICVGAYGLLIGPPKSDSSAPRTLEIPSPSDAPDRSAEPREVLVTSSSEMFARSVVEALFTWDTRTEGGPSRWAQALVNVAHGDEATAVASDIRGYLPSPEMWDRLVAYGTRQWLEIESVSVPDAWSIALEQATAGQIPRGTAAFTVVGIRKRVGTWDTEVISTERSVTFTLFVVCSKQESCALLRLSEPDRALQ